MNIRKVQRRDANLYWHDIDFKELKDADIFRMFEPTGEPVSDKNGETEFVAHCNAYIKDEVWTINILS